MKGKRKKKTWIPTWSPSLWMKNLTGKFENKGTLLIFQVGVSPYNRKTTVSDSKN